MKILGVDYGRKKIGLAIADGFLAEPLNVLKVNSMQEAAEKVSQVSKVSQISKVIVGISEGAMAEETNKFVSVLRRLSTTPIETFDETLSTQDAQRMAFEAGVKRKKRKVLEDAFAASVMLQSYLDRYV